MRRSNPMIHYMSTYGVGDAWVGNELHAMERLGVPFRLHAMRRATRKLFASPWAQKLNDETQVLYPISFAQLASAVLAGPFLFGGRFVAALANALFGRREKLRGRAAGLAHFAVACQWARTLRDDPPAHIHSQWIHSGGTIAMYGAWLLGTSFSFTGHAADLFRERVALRDKIRRADFIVCISEFHRQFFLKEGARPEQLHIVYCGIDVSRFAPPPDQPPATRGAAARPIRIRASGRLVEKKGFEYLIAACHQLQQRGLDFECVIAGSGPLEASLNQQISALGLTERVRITGAEIKQEDIPAFMHSGDIYCLPCVWAADNDVDGLPQMLMEAMACGLPAISTRLVGIPDLITHEKSGLLVEPRDAAALADALARLTHDPALAQQLATAGRAAVLQTFDIATCLQPLADLFIARLEWSPAKAQAAAPAPPVPTRTGELV